MMDDDYLMLLRTWGCKSCRDCDSGVFEPRDRRRPPGFPAVTGRYFSETLGLIHERQRTLATGTIQAVPARNEDFRPRNNSRIAAVQRPKAASHNVSGTSRPLWQSQFRLRNNSLLDPRKINVS